MSKEGPGEEKLEQFMKDMGMNSGSLIGLLGNVMQKDDGIQRDNYRITEILKKFDMKSPCTFKVGDFVTPKPESHYRRPGEPCLVVQAFETCQYQFVEERRPLYQYNMIVARPSLDCDIESVKLYLVESKYFETYTGLVYGDAGEEAGNG